MLPAEDKSRSIGQIVKAVFPHPKAEIGELFISDMNVSESQEEPQHLYFVSNDEIKEGDWVIADYIESPDGNRIPNTLCRVSSCYTESMGFLGKRNVGTNLEQQDFIENAKKVIATTDKLLGLPQIPQSFIESYVKNPVKYQ